MVHVSALWQDTWTGSCGEGEWTGLWPLAKSMLLQCYRWVQVWIWLSPKDLEMCTLHKVMNLQMCLWSYTCNWCIAVHLVICTVKYWLFIMSFGMDSHFLQRGRVKLLNMDLYLGTEALVPTRKGELSSEAVSWLGQVRPCPGFPREVMSVCSSTCEKNSFWWDSKNYSGTTLSALCWR